MLKEGVSTINLRPYRYGEFQQDVIEKIVKEIMDSRVIWHNFSPSASPIVLVKKKMTHGTCV